MAALGADVLTLARNLCSKDSNTLTDAIGISLANDATLDFRQRLLRRKSDILAPTEANLNLTNNYVDGSITYLGGSTARGQIALAATFWLLKSVVLTYQNPVAQRNYRQALPLDSANTPGQLSLDWFRLNTSSLDPRFELRGNVIEVYPTPSTAHFPGGPTVTAFGKYFYWPLPTTFTAVGNTLEYPESLNPGILAHLVAARYLDSLKKQSGDKLDARANTLIGELIDAVGIGSHVRPGFQSVPLTGFEF